VTAPLPPADVMTLDEALRHRVTVLPDEGFIRIGNSPWLTAAELDRRATAAAAGLQQIGVQPGDRVASILPNRDEVVELYFAVAKIGAVVVPLNYWLKGEFLQYQLKDCGARVLVADTDGLAAASTLLGSTDIEVLIDVDADRDSAAATLSWASVRDSGEARLEPYPSTSSTLLTILYTSGTTGLPKGCMLPNGYLAFSGRVYGQREWVFPGDRLFTSWPLFHASGLLNALLPTLMNNASLVFETQFHASTFMAKAREAGATTLMGVGFMGRAILAQPPSPQDSECRFKLAVFPPLPERQQLEFEKRFNTPFQGEGYGQTEILPITCSAPISGPRNRATTGYIAPTIEVRITDENGYEVPDGEIGEITVRPRQPDTMYQGYWGNPAATLQAWRGLWHHTGDSGYKDGDGFLTFVDRKRDVVRRRGENVSTFQLEAAIADHPAIEVVAVTGVAASVGEDDIKASIVLVGGATLDPGEMFVFLRNNVPYYAIPRFLDVRPSMPTNAMGRVMKQSLRDEGLPAGVIDFDELGFSVPREERRKTGVPASQT
jgi:carnitine-CoA ligase